jgi:drug/metabolite transporter (DMT)-like permease
MSPKKVWGVILIVLGVLAVLGGANNYHELEVAGDVLIATEQSLARNFGQFASGTLGGFDAHGLIQREKMSSIAGMLVGILLSIIGTMMLRSTTPQIVYVYDREDEREPLEERKFRL